MVSTGTGELGPAGRGAGARGEAGGMGAVPAVVHPRGLPSGRVAAARCGLKESGAAAPRG